jgi:hypothetical protein
MPEPGCVTVLNAQGKGVRAEWHLLKLDIQENSHGIHGITRKKETMKERFSVLFRGFRG